MRCECQRPQSEPSFLEIPLSLPDWRHHGHVSPRDRSWLWLKASRLSKLWLHAVEELGLIHARPRFDTLYLPRAKFVHRRRRTIAPHSQLPHPTLAEYPSASWRSHREFDLWPFVAPRIPLALGTTGRSLLR